MHKIMAGLAALFFTLACLAGADVNRASEAELDGIKGIGPALSGRILAERKKAPFSDWQDLIQRVRGIRAKSAAKLSDAGLTVNDTAYVPIAASPK
jgi:competence protein ComEA